MALKKTIASSVNNDGTLSPQYDIDMHPLEEASILAFWATGEELMKMPVKPSIEQEHEWLLEFGADYVKQKRNVYQAAYDLQRPNLEAAEAKHQEAHRKWCSHMEMCAANGKNPDTFSGF